MTGAHRYAVYGMVLEIDRPLQSLPSTEGGGTPDLSIAFVEPGYFATVVPPERVVLPKDHWIAHALLADGSFYLRAPDVVEAIVSRDGRRALCASAAPADPRSVEANLLNIVIGTALTLAGEEPLHATAVSLDGQAIGLLGPSGAGKSTLAAFLIRAGATLVTDDVLRLGFDGGAVLAQPGPERLKLLEEAARRFMPDALPDGEFNTLSGKFMVRPPGPRRPRPSVPLKALYFLGDLPGLPAGPGVEASRLAGYAALRVLLSSAMDDRNIAPDRLARQLRFAGDLAARVPLFALRYPRRFEHMEAVAAEIRRTALA